MTLPNGWTEATVKELAGPLGLVTDGDWVESKDQDPSGTVRLIQLADVGVGEFRDRSTRFMTLEAAKRLNCTYLQPGDVLIARMPDPIGRACIFPGLDQPAVTAVDVMLWRTDGSVALADWFAKWINSPKVRAAMIADAGGTTRQRIAGGRIKELRLPLPPLAEQSRIVAKLEALTARLARARVELRQVEGMARTLREKGLEAAFEGTLVSEGEVPRAGWKTVRFDEIGQISSNLIAPRKIMDLPHIAPNHIRSGIPALLPYRTIREDNVISAKNRFFPGQIIYSKIRPNLRKVVEVDFEGACSADMYPISPRCNGRYLLYWMLSPQFTWLVTRQDGRTVLPKINQDALNAIVTPLAAPATQVRIAAALDAIFTRADQLEAEVTRANALLDRLEAVVLAKAFRGELVAQDATNEHASVLLQRISTKQAAAPTLKRKRLPKTQIALGT